MSLNDSTVVTTREPVQELSTFASILEYHLFQTAALANSARALAFEIDEDANNPVIRVLRIVQGNLENLAGLLDEFQLSQSMTNKVGANHE